MCTKSKLQVVGVTQSDKRKGVDIGYSCTVVSGGCVNLGAAALSRRALIVNIVEGTQTTYLLYLSISLLFMKSNHATASDMYRIIRVRSLKTPLRLPNHSWHPKYT